MYPCRDLRGADLQKQFEVRSPERMLRSANRLNLRVPGDGHLLSDSLANSTLLTLFSVRLSTAARSPPSTSVASTPVCGERNSEVADATVELGKSES